MNDEMRKAVIKDVAASIRSKMAGGTLYGEPIDLEDADSLILAAYLIGDRDGREIGGVFHRVDQFLYENARQREMRGEG